MNISELFRTPTRFLRSAQIERDFDDDQALRDYIVTPPIAAALRLVIEGLRPGSRRHAWRVTGDYGSGKSSFALALAHLLRNPRSNAVAQIRKATDLRGLSTGPRMLPILVTGARESLVPAIARGVAEAACRLDDAAQAATFAERAREIGARGDGSALVSLVERLTAFAVGNGQSGVLLIIDEMGKLLEYAALHPDQEDVYLFQRLAEAADRSGSDPLVVVGLLHQGFHAYAESLPAAARHEWEKVAERFQEIVFDQPLAHVAALVGGALGVRGDRAPAALLAGAAQARRQARGTGWFGGGDPEEVVPDPMLHFPLHPTVLPVMARFFGRFGQHERSLFSFLLSSEPFGLQSFANRPVGPGEWLRLPDFYDYVRAVFGYRLAATGRRSQWVRLLETMDGVADVSEGELRLLKTVALLNLIDAEDLLPTEGVLAAALGDAVPAASLQRLSARGLLHRRGATGGFCLWPTTSVNLDAAFEAGARALGQPGSVAEHLPAFLDTQPLLARRHYIEHGTLRYFEVRYAPVTTLKAELARPSAADGVVLVALCDDPREQSHANGVAGSAEAKTREDVIVAVPEPLAGLRADVHDVRVWEWVLGNTPELHQDSYAAAEARRELNAARIRLRSRAARFISFGAGPAAATTHWTRGGEPLVVSPQRGLLPELSPICNDLFPFAPRIHNELLNRRQPSSAAIAARMRLVERMFSDAGRPELGMNPAKAPPERSMYLSVLHAGGVHREEDGRWIVALPPEGVEDADPLRLRPALLALLDELQAAGGERVPVPTLFEQIRKRPFGVREGVIPLLLALLLVGHAHELAVYENGNFVQDFGAAAFLRLTKLPTAFTVQLCRIGELRRDVFHRLVDLVSARPEGRPADILDVVGSLCRFAAELPEYTRRSPDLPATSRAVRDALLGAREPGPLLFRNLPEACGVRPFPEDGAADMGEAEEFAARLQDAMAGLRDAYPALLSRIRHRLARALSLEGALDRAELAALSSEVALNAREPRLRMFALRLGDTGLADQAWTESLASATLAKPPARWAPGDEARCGDELDVLGATFQRVRAIYFHAGAGGAAVRLALTRPDGAEESRVIDLAAVGAAGDAMAQIRDLLPPEGTPERLAVLAVLLHETLGVGQEEALAPVCGA